MNSRRLFIYFPRYKFTIILSIIWLCPKDTEHFLILFDGDRWQLPSKSRRQVRRRPLWNSYSPDYQRYPRPSFPGEAFIWIEATLRAEGGCVCKCSLWRWKTWSISPHCHLVILNTFEQHIDVAKWQQKNLIYKVLADDQCGRLQLQAFIQSELLHTVTQLRGTNTENTANDPFCRDLDSD